MTEMRWLQWCRPAWETWLLVNDHRFCRWWFQKFYILIPTWGNDPIWLIFLKRVTENHQLVLYDPNISNAQFFFCARNFRSNSMKRKIRIELLRISAPISWSFWECMVFYICNLQSKDQRSSHSLCFRYKHRVASFAALAGWFCGQIHNTRHVEQAIWIRCSSTADVSEVVCQVKREKATMKLGQQIICCLQDVATKRCTCMLWIIWQVFKLRWFLHTFHQYRR